MRATILRAACRDLLELVLLPGLAALLPWRWAFAVFRRLARWPWLYREAAERAYAQAHALGWGWPGHEARWKTQRRLVTLVDHADLYLTWTRGMGWWRRHGLAQGHWPQPGAGLLLTFHWGAGMWGLRDARAHGLTPHALVASLDAAHFRGRPVLHAYARWRTRAVAQVLGAPTLDTSASLRPALRALRAGQPVSAAVDVPSDQVSASAPVALAGGTAAMPVGLLRLAVEQRLPVTVYLTGIDLETGRRTLRIESLGVLPDLETALRTVFAELDCAVTAEPTAWHFWGEAPRFFRPPPQ